MCHNVIIKLFDVIIKYTSKIKMDNSFGSINDMLKLDYFEETSDKKDIQDERYNELSDIIIKQEDEIQHLKNDIEDMKERLDLMEQNIKNILNILSYKHNFYLVKRYQK